MGRPVAVVVTLLVGCGFQHGSLSSPGPADGPADATPDGTVCADVVCDPHAACVPPPSANAGPSCECITGYSGNGLTCAAIDPCATSNGGCPAACDMTGPGTSTCYVPATCADIAAHTTVANDSSVTLYVNHEVAKPWTAYCHNGLEYLTVAGTNVNFGQYTQSNKSPGTDVRTQYARMRLDPTNLKIDIDDQTFATSTGTLMHDPANNPNVTVTSMPLGVAMDCRSAQDPQSGQPTGVAKVTLTGTPFSITSDEWSEGGNSSGGNAVLSNGGRVVSITGGGSCGWNAPTGAPSNPFNTFQNLKLITLTYTP